MPRRRKTSFRDSLLGLAIVAGIVMAVNYPVFSITLATIAIVVWLGISMAPRRRTLGTYDISRVDEMSGPEFEHYIGDLFACLGFDVEVTKGSGDYGVDVICEKGGERIAIQAKRHSQKVNLKAVQEVVAGMKIHKCNKSMVITTSYFSSSALKLASHNHCELVNRDQLVRLIQKAAALKNNVSNEKQSYRITARPESERTTVACPSCEQRLRLPKGREGRVICPACDSDFRIKT